jgi:hypothetical protein
LIIPVKCLFLEKIPKLNPMRTRKYILLLAASAGLAFILYACSPVTITSWMNPKESQKISRVVVWGMFDKLENEKPFEQAVTSYFKGRGIKSVEALTIITPGVKYDPKELESKFDSSTADGVLIVSYAGTDKTETYVPPTTTVYPDYYYNYYSYYSWGYPIYYGGGYATTTGGYWATTKTVNLRANLYSTRNKNLLWTAEIQVTDPQYIDEASYQVASEVYADWQRHGIVGKK